MAPGKKSKHWSHLRDEALMDMRICDLGLTIRGSDLEARVAQLHAELEAKGIRFKPPVYLGDEWFTPEGVPTIAMPFYLAHYRLRRLEGKMMLEVEGGTKKECMMLLRHEAGHALAHAYNLRHTRKWRALFGSPSQNYDSEKFRPRPYSRAYVYHLDGWYAQAHPDEDFAETFAVWLTPRSNWKKKYEKWRAIQKLNYIDETMAKISRRQPYEKSREKPYSISQLKLTLRTYYKRKRKLYEEEYPDFYDSDLRRIFDGDSSNTSLELAHFFMRRYQKEIVSSISVWTAERKYTINELYRTLWERTKELGLRISKDQTQLALDVAAYMATLITNHLLTGRYKRTK